MGKRIRGRRVEPTDDWEQRKNQYTGIVKILEDWCATNGLHVPTAEEQEAEAIDRLLEMEGLGRI